MQKLRLVVIGAGAFTWVAAVFAALFNPQLIGLAQTITPVMGAIVAGFGAQEYLERRRPSTPGGPPENEE